MRFLTILSLMAGMSSVVSHADSSLPVVRCDTMSVIEDYNEKTGEPIFTSYKVDLQILQDPSTEYGYVAQMLGENDSVVRIKDTDYSASVELPEEMLGMAQQFIENFDPKDVDLVSHANVGVRANSDDSAGIHLYSLYKKDKSLIGQLGTAGWTFFICE